MENPNDVEMNDQQHPKEFPRFYQTLTNNGLSLVRDRMETLQINIGLACNQLCRHCHLEAGPHRLEMMDETTMSQVADFATTHVFDLVDITGGAPELHPALHAFIDRLSAAPSRLTLRSNLTVLADRGAPLMTFLKNRNVNLVVSLPSLNAMQTEAVRGTGVFEKSIACIRALNRLGYGCGEAHEPTLDIVVNPSGAFLPAAQAGVEKRYRQVLNDRWGLTFDHLFSFANVPLGRFKTWLIESNNYHPYMHRLLSAFNPCAVDGVMCRTLLSVAWDGYLYDCDFNQAAGLPLSNKKTHITEITAPPDRGTPIAVADHCYTCTAGAGFT